MALVPVVFPDVNPIGTQSGPGNASAVLPREPVAPPAGSGAGVGPSSGQIFPAGSR